MRSARFVSLLVLISFARSATAHQATATAPQSAALLQQSLAALSGGHPLTDVTLSGTAERIAGSDDESGTVVVNALAGTGTRIDLTFPSGPHTEIRNVSVVPSAGSWSGPDSVAHAIADQNLTTDPGWFPAFTLASFVTSQNSTINYVGPETKNGTAVIHLTASLQFPNRGAVGAALLQQFSQTQIYLDASTLLPVAIIYAAHPDNSSSTDIPIEIDYSNYQIMNGAQIPLHVQKFINNGLNLDLRFSSAVVNSGLSASKFTVGAGL
jgi:hypothetical protein